MAKDLTKTPIRIYPQVVRGLTVRRPECSEQATALVAQFKAQLEEHGFTYAVNFALAQWLEAAGVAVEFKTPTERIGQGMARRWKKHRASEREGDETAEAEREKRRERDRKRKAAQTAEAADSEQGIEGDLKIEFV